MMMKKKDQVWPPYETEWQLERKREVSMRTTQKRSLRVMLRRNYWRERKKLKKVQDEAASQICM
jgi:hypothetical protein